VHLKVFDLFFNSTFQIEFKTLLFNDFEQLGALFDCLRKENLLSRQLNLQNLWIWQYFYFVLGFVFDKTYNSGHLKPLILAWSHPIPEEISLKEARWVIKHPVVEIADGVSGECSFFFRRIVLNKAISLAAWTDKQHILKRFEPQFVFLLFLFSLPDSSVFLALLRSIFNALIRHLIIVILLHKSDHTRLTV
jgi:hypothetical protein